MSERASSLLDPDDCLLNLALESWKLSKLFARVLSKLETEDKRKYGNKVAYFDKKLDEILSQADLTFFSLQGELYDPGMAVNPLNLSDFSPDDSLIVEQMIEPIVMGKDGIKKVGTVFLRKAH